MARSLVPAAMCMASGVPSRHFVFDADGLVADERVEFAGWNPTGMPYRASRAVERRALRHANITLTRTVAARDILVERGGVSPSRVLVAGNGSDVDRFQPIDEGLKREGRRALGISDTDCLVVYCGSIGPQYHPKLMATFVKALRRNRAPGAVHFLVLSAAEEQAKALLVDAGCDATTGHHRVLAPEDVPAHIALADIGLALREPSLSQRAVAPIKVGEYLLSGVPVLANTGVGDLDTQLGPNDSLLVSCLDVAEVQAAAARFSSHGFDAAVVRRVGLRYFALDAMVSGYQAAYDLAKANA